MLKSTSIKNALLMLVLYRVVCTIKMKYVKQLIKRVLAFFKTVLK